jgi:HAE1 family hydrophobic/amphiphilic exporter-1
MGIVVNDAIVFIDRINTNIYRGMDRREAIIEAGKSRLQPIILTTITTIL